MSEDTLPPLKDGIAPQTFDELWAGFDPRAEPLDVEVLKEWEEDGVVLQVLRYRVGTFKGQKSMLAGVYGYPKDGKNLPGLVQIHGGGQYANHLAPLTNAKRGYASISLSWGGRISAPDYLVDPEVTKLYWEGKTNDPNYRVATDWGALDAYHAPSRDEGEANWGSLVPSERTIDDVESPRNSNWYPCARAARRALTFLEQQPEVDGDRLGVYGHSMGGKLTVMVAGSDDRVKAAAPSCGGVSHRGDAKVMDELIYDDTYLKRITCPAIFLKPANDFHGRIGDLQTALSEIKTDDWRVICAAHHNHQDNAESEVATQLWMDQYLKGTFECPQTPETTLKLETEDGMPVIGVQPDASRKILSVDVFYTQQADAENMDEGQLRENSINRHWHYAPTREKEGVWTADVPLLSADKTLWVYANIVYALDEPVSGAGYYYGLYTAEKFNLSSRMHIVSADQLKAAGVKAMMKPSDLIESFDGDWEKEWFTYRPQNWGCSTHKLYNDKWKASEGARLVFDVRSDDANKLVVAIDSFGAEIELAGGPDWQSVELSASDFLNGAHEPLTGWDGIMELRLSHQEVFRGKVDGEDVSRELGREWAGADPEFRNMRWVGN